MLESQAKGLRSPQNLISPLPSPALATLSAEINAATRGVHARLNKLITSRLPLALPPYAESPEAYAHGINTFAQIYLVFEARWHDFITQHKAGAVAQSTHHADVQEWLADLVPSGLWRTAAIKADLSHLSKTLHVNLDAVNGLSMRNEDLTKHILDITTVKPHTFVAYSWIMYMAIFSGGRWIREQLAQAGSSFWHAPETIEGQFGRAAHPVPGFSLFYFEGAKDGEDIKADYKARLDYAEQLLSERERADIVQEANIIFERCIELVSELDDRLATGTSLPEIESHLASGNARSTHGQSDVIKAGGSIGMGSLMALLAVTLAILLAWIWRSSR